MTTERTPVENGYFVLATTLVAAAIKTLDKPRPTAHPPAPTAPPEGFESPSAARHRWLYDNRRMYEWKRTQKEWRTDRARDAAWLSDPARSAHWCEAARLDWDSVVSRLRVRGILPPLLPDLGQGTTSLTAKGRGK